MMTVDEAYDRDEKQPRPKGNPTWYDIREQQEEQVNNGLASINDTIFPLGGISNKVSVGRNETGQWMIYLSDEYGFERIIFLYPG